MNFFTTCTRNLLAGAAEAGVSHYVALSVVGTERLSDSGYFRAKIAQELGAGRAGENASQVQDPDTRQSLRRHAYFPPRSAGCRPGAYRPRAGAARS